MKMLTQIRFYLVIVILAFIVLFVKYINQSEELLKCKTDSNFVQGGDIEKAELNSKIDSLGSEIFVKDIQIGSYETMWGILEETNKKLADSINLLVE